MSDIQGSERSVSAGKNEVKHVSSDEYEKQAYIMGEKFTLPQNEDENYTLAITGRAFSFLIRKLENLKDPEKDDEKVQQIMDTVLLKTSIFARMKPEEKVGMCGDGANDCSALKTADVGISLSNAEASIAAPFTSKIQDISCVIRLLREGRAALVTSFSCFKFMAIYSIIQFTATVLEYFVFTAPSNSQFLYWDLAIIFPLAFFMGLTKAHKKLTDLAPSASLVSFSVLFSVIGQAIIQASFQVGGYFYMISRPWYMSCVDVHKELGDMSPDTLLTCYESTVIFWIANFQFLITSLAFSIGKPWRRPFYTNYWFTGYFIVVTMASIFIQLHRNRSITEIMTFLYQVKVKDQEGKTVILSEMPESFAYIILLLSIVNSAVTLLFERDVLPYVTKKYNSFKQINNDD